ncbi:ABC transporter permease [Aquabacterium sp.]|uniref:ABC transporter permease n=1 Tax=Aquabacterium sp. TaxID=1872578 RepID=UPI002CE8659D|nr:ABC transporter permease [Aquabacterium sp.]HSW08383.1 ABC transporter permease [Aquabacterium sp.]
MTLQAWPAPWRPWLLIAPATALIGLFMVLPYLNIVVMSLREPATNMPYGSGFSGAGYAKFFADFYYAGALLQTLWIGLLSTAVCLLLGFPLAWQIVRAPARRRALLYGIVLSPLLVGIVVRSYGWTILLGNNGVINRWLLDLGWIQAPLPLMYNSLGIVVALSHVFLPFMVLPIMGALQAIDPALDNAARSLGATPRRVFRRIVLPLALPGIQAGAILVFVLAVSAYVTPVLMGGMRVKTLAVIVVETLIDQFQWPFGSALALILSASVTLLVLVFMRLTRMPWK